jgi:hypothetical protein
VRVSYSTRPTPRESDSGGQTSKSQNPCTAEEMAQLELILATASKHAEPAPRSNVDDQTSHRRTRRNVEGQDREHKRPRISAAEEKDRRLRQLVSELVKQRLSMHKPPIDREIYKKHAREVSGVTRVSDKPSGLIFLRSYQCLHSTLTQPHNPGTACCHQVYRSRREKGEAKRILCKLVLRLSFRRQAKEDEAVHRPIRQSTDRKIGWKGQASDSRSPISRAFRHTSESPVIFLAARQQCYQQQ